MDIYRYFDDWIFYQKEKNVLYVLQALSRKQT